MRRLVVSAFAALTMVAAACTPKTVPAPAVTAPKFPEFIRPAVPGPFANSPVAEAQARGWAFLQTGDLKTAEREFAAALKTSPTFYPADTSLGYVELARKDAKAALPHFDRVIEQQAKDVAALVGRGQSLIALGRDTEAVVPFETAVALDPSLTDLAVKIEVLKFRGAEQGLTRARDAAKAGRLDEAVRAYTSAITSSPDSPFLYRELAAVEKQKGDADAALGHFQKAVSLDPADAKSLAQIGELFDARNDSAGAVKAYSDSFALEANPDVARRLEDLKARAAMAALPEEFRAIDQAPLVTRADLAALVGIRLAPLLQAGRRSDAALITDVRGNWAASWIMAVARAGVMEPFANHAFQPKTTVRRADLAQTLARLLAQVAQQNPARARGWDTARLKFPDLQPSHLAYPAASVAVAAGAMTVGPDGAFQPGRAVTGAEAAASIAKIGSLAGLR
ncbi:MAG TPA: S-layer homology domain-containing protein [Vicinamibacterales bacterium]